MGAGRSAQRSAQRRSDNDPSGGADNLAQRIRRSCSDPPAYKSSQTCVDQRTARRRTLVDRNTKRRASSAGSILRVVLPGSSEPDDDTKSETGGRHMQVLNSILAEAHECALFRSFLDSEYCVELLDFVLVVHRFERLYSSLHSARPSTPNLKCEAGVIFNRFLKDASAPDYVSLVATEGVDLHLKNDTLNVKTFQAARTEAVVMRDAGSAQPNVESFLDALHDFEKYKRPAGAPTTDAQLLLIAKRVYDRFVAPASPASVGASSLLASRVRQKLEVGSIDADLFEPCRAEAARVLAETQFERFATWIEADETAAAHFRLDYVAQAAELAEAESVNAPPKKKPTSQPNSPQPKSSSRLNKSPKPESSSRLLESQRERRDSAMLLRCDSLLSLQAQTPATFFPAGCLNLFDVSAQSTEAPSLFDAAPGLFDAYDVGFEEAPERRRSRASRGSPKSKKSARFDSASTEVTFVDKIQHSTFVDNIPEREPVPRPETEITRRYKASQLNAVGLHDQLSISLRHRSDGAWSLDHSTVARPRLESDGCISNIDLIETEETDSSDLLHRENWRASRGEVKHDDGLHEGTDDEDDEGKEDEAAQCRFSFTAEHDLHLPSTTGRPSGGSFGRTSGNSPPRRASRGSRSDRGSDRGGAAGRPARLSPQPSRGSPQSGSPPRRSFTPQSLR